MFRTTRLPRDKADSRTSSHQNQYQRWTSKRKFEWTFTDQCTPILRISGWSTRERTCEENRLSLLGHILGHRSHLYEFRWIITRSPLWTRETTPSIFYHLPLEAENHFTLAGPCAENSPPRLPRSLCCPTPPHETNAGRLHSPSPQAFDRVPTQTSEYWPDEPSGPSLADPQERQRIIVNIT